MKALIYAVTFFILGGWVMAQECELGAGNCSKQPFGGAGAGARQHHSRKDAGQSRETMMVQALTRPEVAKKLELTDDQQKKLNDKLTAFQHSQLDLKHKMKKAAMKQARLMTAKELDEDAIMSVVEEMGEYRIQRAKDRMGLMIFMRKTLEPQQLDQLRGLMRERMRGHKMRGNQHKNKRSHHGDEDRRQRPDKPSRHERGPKRHPGDEPPPRSPLAGE
jgi:Spy/CpxP family protein refolding chaperone